ncbi:MAG: hypothetical protein IJD91_08510 [Clostridia bacterium]|nr:hypothetical protein [Clostridia bacterium]
MEEDIPLSEYTLDEIAKTEIFATKCTKNNTLLHFGFYICNVMIIVPYIADYKPFFIQTESDTVARDTTEWGLIAKVNPYPLLPNPKEPFKNEWPDEHGDDEWCEKIYYKPIEFTVSFYIKAQDSPEGSAEEVLRNKIEDFFSFIREKEFMVFDSYNGIGRRKVRYAGYHEDSFTRKRNWARAIFQISFKVNDPITRMVMYNGAIVER